MIKFLNTTTQKLSAAIMTGALLGFSSDAAQAQSGLDTYTDAVAGQATGFTDIINLVCYTGGAGMCGLGLYGVKQHVDQGGQVPLKTPITQLCIGGCLVAFPVVLGNFQDGLGGSGTTEFNTFANPSI